MREASKQIQPTHTCFDDALELFGDILRANQDASEEARNDLLGNLFLVHAIVEPGDEQTAHAWVEHEGWDQMFIVGLVEGERVAFTGPRAEYDRVHRVVKKFRYSYSEAFAENRRTGTYGPWVPEIDALCGNGAGVTMLEPIPLVRISQ